MRKFIFCVIFGMTTVLTAMASNVKVTMNAISTTMTLAEKTSGNTVAVGEPVNKVYQFEVAAGTYVLTAYDTDGTTVNGSIELTVGDEDLVLSVFTITAYATNSGWVYGTDYTIDYQIVSKTGELQNVVMGDSKTAGRKTFLALNGHTYYIDYVPSEARRAEGFTVGYKSGTVSFNVSASMAIPAASVVALTAPEGATVFVGRKTSHFVPFIEILSDSVNGNTYYYTLAANTEYNYRVSKPGKLTQGGVFKAGTGDITVSDADMDAKSPSWIDHNVTSNDGYNVADIFLNINAQEHLKLSLGDRYDLITLRNWEIVNSITSNYFIEPDYHFFVTDLNGQASNSVVTIDPDGTLHAVGNGSAIVTVTYDAIRLAGMTGGEYWSAIWPENTGVFIVTVGQPATGIELGMIINETNTVQYKLAGTAYDADFDVLYFPDTVGAYTNYTFHPTGVQSVEVAYPTLGTNAATYSGFGTEGVTYDSETGNYTVQVRLGRQIVRLTNAAGQSEYQVLVGKPVHVQLTALGREQTGNFQPGDKIQVQLSGLFHPANKMAGIHNFNASTIYHHESAELKSASNQYTFCSAPAAQAFTVTLPDTFNVAAANYEYRLEHGVIKVGGFGDPIGNHRNTSKQFGRGANFTAIAQTAVFGQLPDIVLPLRERPAKSLQISVTPSDATVALTDMDGKEQVAEEGVYALTTANYIYTIEKAGYNTLYDTVRLTDDSPALTALTFTMTAIDSTDTGWDGVTTNFEPAQVDDWYIIRSGYQMAWFAAKVNSGSLAIKGKLANDISLDGHPWKPVGGTTASKAFKGQFDGQNHTIDGLYINSTATYQGLFGYVQNAAISNLEVQGEVTSTANYAAGVAAMINATTITNCASRVNVSGANYVGGIVGNVSGNSSAIRNAYYLGTVTGTGNNVGAIRANATAGQYEHIYSVQACRIDTMATIHTSILTERQFADGTAAWLLRPAFGQRLGSDLYPVLGADMVYQLGVKEDTDTLFTYINATEQIDTMWVNNIAAFYYNEEAQQVTEIHSDTIVSLMIEVKPLTGAATFEDRTLRPESAWYGDPDFEEEDNYWNSGDYVFSTYVDDWGSSGVYYYDITMANITSKDFGWGNPYYDQYSAAGGAAEGNNYAIWYANWYGNANVTLTTPHVLTGMAVTNSAWVVNDILNGDGMSVEPDGSFGQPFHKGDWLCLTITGYGENSEITGTVQYYLADFRDTVNCDWTYAENWQWVDLSSLGTVSEIGFALTSSKNNQYGMSTPAYFCFDNLGGNAADCRIGALTHVDGKGTGLNTLDGNTDQPRKFIFDGRVYILHSGILYDSTGRRVK